MKIAFWNGALVRLINYLEIPILPQQLYHFCMMGIVNIQTDELLTMSYFTSPQD